MRSIIASCSLLLALLVTSATAWSSDGRILGFEGDVQVNGQPLTSDTLLSREDTVTTGSGASVKIILSDNSVLDLDGNTEIKISDYSYDTAEADDNVSKIDVSNAHETGHRFSVKNCEVANSEAIGSYRIKLSQLLPT